MNVLNSLSLQDNALSSALLSLSKNGILVLEYVQTPTPSFRIRQANDVIYQFATGFPSPLVGAYIDQLPIPFNSTYLVQQLQKAIVEGNSRFQLIHPAPSIDVFPIYDCQLVRVDEQVLVLSVELIKYSPDDSNFQEQVLEAMPIGLILLRALRDDEGGIVDFQATFCNQIGADISRQSRDDILTRPISERYPNMQTYELFYHYSAVVTTGKSHHQLQYLAKQDSWLDMSIVKFADGLLVCFQDVTLGQKTASLLESVMKSSPAAIRYHESIRDESGQIIDFLISTGNELEAFRHFRPFESITGQRLLELYPYLKTNGLFERYVAVVETGQSDHFETAYPIGSSTVWFDCTAVRHGNGFVVTTLDITARKQAQLAHQQQAELLTGVLDSSPNSILVLEAIDDEQGEITDFRIALTNPSTLRMLPLIIGKNLIDQDLTAHTIRKFLPESNQQKTMNALAGVVKTRQSIRRQADYPEMNVSYAYDITPFRNGVLLITTDITPLREYQRKLEANNAALSRSNEHLQQFAYIASHDLQEPLRKIQSFGDLLREQYAIQLGEGVDYLERLQSAAVRMSTLIKDLLSFSRISTGQVVTAPVSLDQVINAALTDLELVIQETHAHVHIEPLPTVQGDASQLVQLFQNLISNALKFRRTDTSPRIGVSSKRITVTELPDSAKPNRIVNTYYRIDVSDNGIGFDEKYIDRIFQVFQRLHGRNEFAGTGIGLAICEKVVANHGGAIMASSKPGQGATFTVFLPT